MEKKINGFIDIRINSNSFVWIRSYYKVRDLENLRKVSIDTEILDEHNIDYEITETHDLIINEKLCNIECFFDS